MRDDANNADAEYHFFSYVRRGFCSTIEQTDTFGSEQPSVASAGVGIDIISERGKSGATRTMTLVGPGDVIGIAASQVVRTDPVDGAVGVEPNYFALVEFDAPDLPWVCTPAAPVGMRLRPWIVLVVVDADGPAAASLAPATPLPVLHVSAAAAATLPDLADSWCWAHAQATVPAGTAPESAFADGADPRLAIARLMCPRHLEPNRRYLAAVVPAFEVGRLAGLDQGATVEQEARLEPAWQAGTAVDLPVYYSWSFRTGEGGDFEYLASQLHSEAMPQGVGVRPLDVSRPGAGLPPGPPPASVNDQLAITWLGGALQPAHAPPPPLDGVTAYEFERNLTMLLEAPAVLPQVGELDPVVAPPVYGGRHAFTERVANGAPPWIGELNLDPCNRVAAGLGTRVIQHNQEAYMARAWRQLGDVLAANSLLRAAQLARGASQRQHDRLAHIPPAALVRMFYPAHQRLPGMAPDQTLAHSIALSRLPDVAVQPAFARIARRLYSPPGLADRAIERFAAETFAAPVAGPDGSTNMRPAGQVIGSERSAAVLDQLFPTGEPRPELDAFMATLASTAPAMPPADSMGGMAMDPHFGAVWALKSLGAARVDVRAEAQPGNSDGTIWAKSQVIEEDGFTTRPVRRGPPPPDQLGEADLEAARELVEAVKAALARAVHATDAPAPPEAPALDMGQAWAELMKRSEPERTLPALVYERVDLSQVRELVRRDELDPIMAWPRFNDPMWKALQDLPGEAQQGGNGNWLLPGLELVPHDTATLARTNSSFIAAYLVGLNHEMMRELLWRGYPTDQLGTPFRCFWGRLDQPVDEIGPLHQASGALGAMLAGGPQDHGVLLLRSELVHRYPGALIYLCRASGSGDQLRLLDGDPNARVTPMFRHELPPDILFAGFPLTPDALGDATDPWYVVLAPPPTAPRFGLDVASESTLGPPVTASDLAWNHMAPDGAPATPVPFAIAHPAPLADVQLDGVKWGESAAALARLTYQNPVRVAIRAIDLLSAAGAP